jgi:exonuclease SbcC
VHRDVAPVLADAVGRRLPALTGGRYTHVLVDPRTLDVQVREQGGAWRRAALLSHGAAEQVYLLLRLALTEHLTRPGEVCPLILDDVLVQSDAQRKAALLRVLEEAGQQRQVILFTQEDTVFAWARTHLTAPVHRVQRLDAAAAAADRFQRMAAAVSS